MSHRSFKLGQKGEICKILLMRLPAFELANRWRFGTLTVFPLFGSHATGADYLTLDEALEQKCAAGDGSQ